MDKDSNDRAEAAAVLRRKALAVQAAHPSTEKTGEALKELQVHQIELEMQNDELFTAQANLQASRERYFELFDQAPVGYCTVSEASVIEEANLKAADLLGVAAAQLVDQKMTSFIFRDDQDLYYRARKELFETGNPHAFELRMLRSEVVFWAQLSATLTQGADGATACRMVIEDISRRKHAEEALAAEKNRLDVTLRSITDGVAATDASGLLVLMNPSAQRLCGWTEEEAIGQPIGTVLPVIDELSRVPRENLVLRVLVTGTADQEISSVLLLSRDGDVRYINDSASPIRGADGTVEGAVFVFRDVTEHRRMEELAQHAEKLDSLGVLAGGIAHDFNNLLGGIFGYLTLAKSTLADNPVVLDYLNKAGSVFHRAKALTQQLMTFSKGGVPLRKTGRLAPIVRGSATYVLTGSNIDCDFSFSDDLDLCDFDGQQMSQVFTNLILNAKQSMPLGGRILISAHNTVLKRGEVPFLPLGNYLKISVADHGEGIPHHLFKKIFDPFFTTRKTNQGLGLPTAQSIIHKHGGEIEVQSEPGKGTTIHVYLPSSVPEAALEADDVPAPRSDPGTILVMDDEPFMREIIREMLKSIGYGVIEAGSGEAALSLCSQGQELQAAILDLTVKGGMSGKDTLAAIRSVLPDLPIFASSGFSEDPIMASPKQYGFTAGLGKPFQQEELARLMSRYLTPR